MIIAPPNIINWLTNQIRDLRVGLARVELIVAADPKILIAFDVWKRR